MGIRLQAFAQAPMEASPMAESLSRIDYSLEIEKKFFLNVRKNFYTILLGVGLVWQFMQNGVK